MIAFRKLALRRGPHLLFSDLDAAIHSGWKLAVTGRNGCGKSSLFAAIRGELDSDSGQIDQPAGLRVASVAQETPATSEPAIDYVLKGDAEAAAAVLAAERAEAEGDHAAAAKAHQRIESLNAYDARARAGRLLHGLGFAPETHSRAVAEFSGGWRVRLNLAAALMAPSDLLLLDEPTNHLDLDAVLWLEQWLKHYQGVLMVISHDREFLDAVADHVLHLEQGSGQLYSGNYSAFERQRAEQLHQQQASHEKEQAERAHLEAFIRRFGAKATKARQAQSRVKRLEKLAGTEAVRIERAFHFRFPEPARVPQSMLKLVDAAAGYKGVAAPSPPTPSVPPSSALRAPSPASGRRGSRQEPFPDGGEGRDAGPETEKNIIVANIKLGLEPGDRIGLLGVNGAGKTTLVRSLVGELPLLAGTRTAHKDLDIGYFAQHTVEALESGRSPFEHMRDLAPDEPQQSLRDWLGRWHFAGDRAFEDVDRFSGGERARLALALIAWRKPNLLLLDEPTNHLDMDMREALAEALNEYDGALVLVSHDRHLLGLVCDEFWHVAEGRALPFDGDLDDYAEWSRKHNTQAAVGNRQRKARSKPAGPSRQQLKQWRQQQRSLERQVEQIDRKLGEIEQHLADPDVWQQPTAELADLGRKQATLRADKERLESEWFEVGEQLEKAGA